MSWRSPCAAHEGRPCPSDLRRPHRLLDYLGLQHPENALEHDSGFQELAYPPFVAIVVGGGYAFVMRQWAHDRQAIRSRHPRLSSPVVSLNKVRIHQTDKDIQRAEIERLGAFIHASDEMVVLYSDVSC